jgi:hypothetical protein
MSALIIPIVAGAVISGALAVQRDFSPTLVAVSALGGSLTFGLWWWFFVTRRKTSTHQTGS